MYLPMFNQLIKKMFLLFLVEEQRRGKFRHDAFNHIINLFLFYPKSASNDMKFLPIIEVGKSSI